jgi:ribA/ribD-fused uncharacterized protein
MSGQNPGPGPRWIGDQQPNLPSALHKAADLPPKVTESHVFFFGYEGPEPEVCFQQWYPSPFADLDSSNGTPLQFGTSEQYMMYAKALLMSDFATAQKILAASGPAEAKALGREVKNFDQGTWERYCDAIVEKGNYSKFSQNERLKGILLGTGAREIVETSPNDRFWGIGFDTENAEGNVGNWGENRLGKALMRVRDRLKREAYDREE